MNTPRHTTGLWVLGAIALGLLLTGGGIWVLSWQAQTSSAAIAQPTATHIRAALPTWTATLPLPPTASSTPQPTPTPTSLATATRPASPTPSPTASRVAASTPLELAIVHSNDTWGYVQPCG